MLIPLYGFLQGDTIGMLVLAHDDDPVAAVRQKMLAAARVRVDTGQRRYTVEWKGQRLDETMTVAAAGLSALDRVDVVHADSP